MNKLYFFPSEPLTGYQNPYCNCFKQALSNDFEVLDMVKNSSFKRMFKFLIMSFKADVFVLNWIESSIFWRFGFVIFIFNVIALHIIKCRNRKIVWMFHNIHPHNGSNRYSEYIQNWLFRNANIIISHSKDAAKYASLQAKGKVLYQCHPVEEKEISLLNANIPQVDIFIWGAIEPYKGIVEFLESGIAQKHGFKIKIIGKSKIASLTEAINKYCSSLVTYENRHADFCEIKDYCLHSRYVLFPYVGNSVSSSGALIDTIAFGGTPVGPNVGAFKDLNEDKVCITYRDYHELEQILLKNYSVSDMDRKNIIEENSWQKFSKRLISLLS